MKLTQSMLCKLNQLGAKEISGFKSMMVVASRRENQLFQSKSQITWKQVVYTQLKLKRHKIA